MCVSLLTLRKIPKRRICRVHPVHESTSFRFFRCGFCLRLRLGWLAGAAIGLVFTALHCVCTGINLARSLAANIGSKLQAEIIGEILLAFSFGVHVFEIFALAFE